MRRFYIAVLVASVAAFFVVPVAQAAAGTVKVKTTGSGTGKIREITLYTSSEPEPINCPSVCTGSMPEEYVALGVFAGESSEFAGWTVTKGTPFAYCDGSAEEKEAAEEIGKEFPEYAGMDGVCFTEEAGGSVELAAAFNASEVKFPLTIAKTGEGTVTSSPAGIECTGAKTGAECVGEFGATKTVTLTASPATGYAFSAWAGCTEHVGLTCKVTMPSKALTVKVTFVATPSLTIEKAGTGQGKALATGISCDENCSKASSAVKTGTVVTVKPTPAKGSEAAVFEGGTGSASGCSGAVCTFTIEASSSVKVKFNAAPTKTLTVKLTGPAAYKGKVSGKGTAKGLTLSAINCGAGCTTQTESFFASDTVILTAAAGTGYTFAGWSGCDSEPEGKCAVATSSNKTVSAEFK